MKEYPEISLDRFDGENLQSAAFFLSHCHSDHMRGLDSVEFIDSLARGKPHVKLYMHDISAGLLLAIDRYADLGPHIVTLPTGEQHPIPIFDKYGKLKYHVCVTLLPAAHCPGSVMFFFEGHEGNVIYTGDFRFHVGEVLSLRPLFDSDKKLLTSIRSVYVDTTFCVPEAKYIPTRDECKTAIVDLVSDWLQRTDIPGHSRIAHIFSRSSYGYEYLMMSLAKHFQCKVHVSQGQYYKYCNISDRTRIITADPLCNTGPCGHGLPSPRPRQPPSFVQNFKISGA